MPEKSTDPDQSLADDKAHVISLCHLPVDNAEDYSSQDLLGWTLFMYWKKTILTSRCAPPWAGVEGDGTFLEGPVLRASIKGVAGGMLHGRCLQGREQCQASEGKLQAFSVHSQLAGHTQAILSSPVWVAIWSYAGSRYRLGSVEPSFCISFSRPSALHRYWRMVCLGARQLIAAVGLPSQWLSRTRLLSNKGHRAL